MLLVTRVTGINEVGQLHARSAAIANRVVICLIVIRCVNQRKLRAGGQRSRRSVTAEADALAKGAHRAAAGQVRVPAVFGLNALGLVIRPSKVARHRLAKVAEHVRVCAEARVVARREVSAVGVRGREVYLQHALDDDRHLDVVGLPRLGKRNRKKRELPLLVVPLARRAEEHVASAVVYNADRRGGGRVCDKRSVIR